MTCSGCGTSLTREDLQTGCVLCGAREDSSTGIIESKDSGREILNGLTEEQWLDLLNRLTLFTRRCYFGIDGRDPIQEAILAVMSGSRSWDVNKDPFRNLCSIVRSITSNQLAKDKRFIQLDLDTEVSACDTPSIQPSELPLAEAYEQRESDEKFRTRICESLQDDKVSLRVAQHLIDDDPEWKPQKISEALGEEKREINNARKRIARKFRPPTQMPKRAL